uniref:Mitogen-activated protein kinase n=1 Tax=Florenciella parvula TaxID=236787 RepID=A0A7S2CJN2_9STRA|mmetsp:Transcript_29926/g.61318  ORF Transcript_29926/g.61318 Transcript_29926/m.61318 type:complete len:391 (+) Transcript_29926:230-1402(+)|eukprot:CAMPEP_0119469560 /NCGR_PEP_ID=MMETSP1344-20130328/2831_1 /TAXON_ID=236787 /ORGANISM="Florenciella parvula, Strain CCMP2471" /LENGTH=390 /DNA_ID=CAMNT_0007502129 /DNA_START=223 /DNA_END=1395 /DNA_ORIENTATION=+
MSDDIDKHVRRRFDIQQRLGKGAYGIVWQAKEKRSGTVVALKKCFDAFRNATDAQRTYREIMYLQKLSGHDNIIRLQHVIRAENDRDIYLTFDHMETDLHAVIRANILEEIHKKYIIYQLLKSLKFMHSGELLHRDIKPSNLLLNSDCHVKLCDFGLCRSVAETLQNSGPNPVLTDYVATRWYRAPEILLGSTHYTKGVDMWAVGCILGEMLLGKPLFPGTSTMNQLEKIIEVTGEPHPDAVENMKSPFAATMLQSLAKQRSINLQDMLADVPQHVGPEAHKLLESCLNFNPSMRCTAEEALAHPYVSEFHNQDDEPIYPYGPIFITIDDNTKLHAADYRDRLYREISKRKKELRRRAERGSEKGASSESGGGAATAPKGGAESRQSPTF